MKTGELNVLINYTLNSADFPANTYYFRCHCDISDNAYIENINKTVLYVNERKDIAYVSISGSDDNSGSMTYPFATFQKAINEGYKKIIGFPGIYKNQNLHIADKSDIEILCLETSQVQDNYLENVKRRARIVFDNSN
jgi:hypothetical protein